MVMPARCEQCGDEFDPLDGGICPACRRLLCPAHRWGWRRLFRRAGGRVPDVCLVCQRADRTASASPETP